MTVFDALSPEQATLFVLSEAQTTLSRAKLYILGTSLNLGGRVLTTEIADRLTEIDALRARIREDS